MSVGFAIRSLGDGVTPVLVTDCARRLDVREVGFAAPPRSAGAWREALRPLSIRAAVVGVGADALSSSASGEAVERLARAATAAATLRARSVRVDAGTLPAGSGEGSAIREAQVERLLRLLHPLTSQGTPVSVRLGRGPGDLLLPKELGWVLSELPAVGVWFDGARAAHLAAEGLAPAPSEFASRLAGRTIGVTVSGRGRDGHGGGHPEDGGLDWSTLVGSLPRSVAWIVDLDPDLGPRALEDAVRVTKSWFTR